MSTIIIGVDETERSEDAIAFGRRLADAATAHVIVANAYPYSDVPSRAASVAYRNALREDALEVARRLRDQFPEDRSSIRIAADPSPPRALHELAHSEHAALVIVGSTHTGRVGRVMPGSTGERLLHGSPCSVAVVPKDYREHARDPIRRIGVAFNDSEEANAAVAAAATLAQALGAELEVISVVSPDTYSTPAAMSAASSASLRVDVERHVQERLDELVAGLPGGCQRARRAGRRRPGRRADRAQPGARPADHRLARLRAAALGARGRRRGPPGARGALPGDRRPARDRVTAAVAVRRRDHDGGVILARRPAPSRCGPAPLPFRRNRAD